MTPDARVFVVAEVCRYEIKTSVTPEQLVILNYKVQDLAHET